MARRQTVPFENASPKPLTALDRGRQLVRAADLLTEAAQRIDGVWLSLCNDDGATAVNRAARRTRALID